MHTLESWTAKRSGTGITVTGANGEKVSVDRISSRNGKVIGTRFKPMDIGRVYDSDQDREIDEEFELLV